MVSAAAVPRAPSGSGFLVSARFDITWFFASMAISYGMMAIYLVAGPGPQKSVVVGLYLAFQLLFNMPHNAQTWTLTVLEPAELAAHRARYLGSLVVTLVLLGGTMAASPAVGWPLLNSAVIYWGYWHLIKQHFGFVRMYEMRRGVRDRVDQALSRAALYAGGLAPLVHRIAHGPVMLDAGRGRPMEIAHPELPSWVATGAWVVAGTLVGVYVLRQLQQRARGNAVAPLAVATLLCAVANFVVAMALVDDLIVSVAIMTTWHDLQYLGLVWFMSRNRAAWQQGGRHLVKLAGQGRWRAYAGWLALYAVVILGFRVVLPDPWGAFPITLVVALHYFHDSFIWKIGSNPHLREELGLAPPRTSPA
ncbi:MAG: hypothetical protein HY904_18575 [Deltaproteobacteria bacterium]|nr:hypothetical protein [Deltaproteobacteria bacterium]